MTETSDIFILSDSPSKVICPPDQVFRNNNFEYLLTLGGHFVENPSQYRLLMDFLKEIGEKKFVLRENFGATITDSVRTTPFDTVFSTNSSLTDFDKKLKEFDEDEYMAGTILHWFIHGGKETWGIYISEYPTINIIGCSPDLADGFRKIFRVRDNGYEQVKSLLESEFKSTKMAGSRKDFLANYKITNLPQ